MDELEIGTPTAPIIQAVPAVPVGVEILGANPPDIELFQLPTATIQIGVPGSVDESAILQDYQEAEADAAIEVGQPIYLKPNGHVALASAAAIGMAQVCGLALINAVDGMSVMYSPDGVLNLPDWTAITGSVNLTPGAVYFLSTLPGKLSTTAPTESGQVVIAVGNALSTSKLAIEVQSPIAL